MFDSLIIRVVDDDESIRTTLKEVLEQNGWNCVTYCSAEEMLREDAISVPGCIVLDLKMEGMSGLELQTELNKRGSRLPIIFFSGHGDVDSAVLAMKHGAVNFLRKATGVSELLKAVSSTLGTDGQADQLFKNYTPGELVSFYENLTPQEKEVVFLVAEGFLNSDIARKLGVSSKTVRNYKVHIRQKLQLNTPAEISLFMQKIRSILKD